MSDETAEKIHDAAARDILSERTLKYKRNLYITSIFALVVFYGKIESDMITLSGLKFTLPNAETAISTCVLLILIYYLISFLRYANGEYALWQERIGSAHAMYLTNWKNSKESNSHFSEGVSDIVCNEKQVSVSINRPNGRKEPVYLTAPIYHEIMARKRYYKIFEYGLTVGFGFASLALLLGKAVHIL